MLVQIVLNEATHRSSRQVATWLELRQQSNIEGPSSLPVTQEERNMTANNPLTGVVLAGGSSRRFGRDKALLELPEKASWLAPAGTTMLDWSAQRLRSALQLARPPAEPEVLVARRDGELRGNLTPVPDGPGKGPVAGILGAAAARPGHGLLVLACDLPLVPVELLAELAAGGGDWYVPRDSGGLQPLCSRWGPRALSALAERVASGVFGLSSLAEGADGDLDIRFLAGEELADWEKQQHPLPLFLNCNQPDEWDRIVRSTPPRRTSA